MRIAQVVPRGEQPWSGILTVIVHLAAALRRRGHDVDVLQLHDWPLDAYTEQRRTLSEAGVEQVPVGASWLIGRATARIAEERGADVVHLHGAFNPSNTAVSRALRVPYVFSPHSAYDPVSLTRGRFRKRTYRLLFERSMLAHASMLTALTDVELRHLRAFGADGPCDVVPNGVEPAPADLDRRVFRTELGIDPDELLAVFVGRLDVHRKGLDVLVRGIADAPGWQLALIGPRFRDVDHLEALITQLSVGGRVHLVGERHGRGLQEALAGADVFTLLSRWEGMPMALLEALAAGTPSIVSPAVGSLVGVAEAGAGWVAGDGELGTVLRSLRGDPAALTAPRHAARDLSASYTWELAAERYERTYERAQGRA